MNELVERLMVQVGIDHTQATGGAGLLFSLAREQLPAAEFARVRAALPEIDNLLQAAPDDRAEGTILGWLSGLASGFGFGRSRQMAGVAEGFSQLGLSADSISRFIPVVLQFAEEKGGEEIAAILKSVLKPG